MTKHFAPRLTFLSLLFAVTGTVHAADAGSVTFASGAVSAERQPAAVLVKGDVVLVEDVVITGDASRAQLTMIDGARIAIRPNSRLRIEEYAYTSAATAATSSIVTTGASDSSVISLVKGGFRAITGAIGKADTSNYKVRTAVGVLGIRGTTFALLFCSGDCDGLAGVPSGTAVPNGLYIMVSEGTIVFSNEVADIDVGAGQFAFIPLDTRRPTVLDATPAVFIDDSDLRFEPDNDKLPAGFDEKLGTRRVPDSSAPDPDNTDESGSGDHETPAQPIQGIDKDGTPFDLTPGSSPDPGNRTIAYSTGLLGAIDTVVSGTLDNLVGQYQLDGNNNVTHFDNVFPPGTATNPATFDIGTATNVESGFDTITVLRWGRWSGGTASITMSDGTDASLNLGRQSIHWISSPEWTAPPVMPITGNARYTLIGATSPTDNMGNTGVLGSATFVADFTNMQVDSTLVIDINGLIWSAAGRGDIGALAKLPAHLFQGNYAVTVGGVTGGAGVFSGFFSQPGPTSDASYPGGVGLTYSLQDPGGATTVSGAAAFGNP
ncbi:MAG: FecR family protein [Woeseiaceae bacterium]